MMRKILFSLGLALFLNCNLGGAILVSFSQHASAPTIIAISVSSTPTVVPSQIAPSPLSSSMKSANQSKSGIDWSIVIATASAFIALVSAIFAFLYTRVAQKDLTLTAYNHAVREITDIKDMFASRDPIFPEELDENPGVRNFIPARMQKDTRAFLTFASGFWRFSYVFSVWNRGKKFGLTPNERDGLRGEMLVWLQDIPGFYEVYKTHISITRRHNPAFLTFLEDIYQEKRIKDKNTLLAVLLAQDIRIKPLLGSIKCDHCKTPLVGRVSQHLLYTAEYNAFVYFCDTCEIAYNRGQMIIRTVRQHEPITNFSLGGMSTGTYEQLKRFAEKRRLRIADGVYYDYYDAYKEPTCDCCGKELTADKGYTVAYRVWKEIDATLVLFHFDKDCYRLLATK